jgi:fucose 4-O-acetylase-like acetyltransferase
LCPVRSSTWLADPSTDAADTTRDRSLDVAKALAITAIVVSHVLRGLAADDDLPRKSAAFLEVDDGLYSWHVAVFALVAGVFLRPGVEKRGQVAYLRPRVILFAYLYVVWTVIQAGIQFLSGAADDGTQDVDGFFVAFPVAYGQLWWLGFMVMATLVGTLVRPWLSRPRAAVSTLAVLALSLAAWGWTGPWLFEEGVALLLFFWVGVLAGRVGLARLTTSSWTPWVALVGVSVGVGLLVLADPMPPSSWIGPRTASAVALGVVTSTALCAGALGVSGLLSRTPLVRPLGLLGERSLEIFLGHLVAISFAGWVLGLFDVDHMVTQICVGTVAGLALPLGLWWLGRRVGFPWLFASPWK